MKFGKKFVLFLVCVGAWLSAHAQPNAEFTASEARRFAILQGLAPLVEKINNDLQKAQNLSDEHLAVEHMFRWIIMYEQDKAKMGINSQDFLVIAPGIRDLKNLLEKQYTYLRERKRGSLNMREPIPNLAEIKSAFDRLAQGLLGEVREIESAYKEHPHFSSTLQKFDNFNLHFLEFYVRYPFDFKAYHGEDLVLHLSLIQKNVADLLVLFDQYNLDYSEVKKALNNYVASIEHAKSVTPPGLRPLLIRKNAYNTQMDRAKNIWLDAKIMITDVVVKTRQNRVKSCQEHFRR